MILPFPPSSTRGEEDQDIFLVNSVRWVNLTNGEVVIIFASEKKKGGMNDG